MVVEIDDVDLELLGSLQQDCKRSLSDLGEQVGLSAPSVLERVRKLERAGIISGYHALVDGRRVGLDVTAFVGVGLNFPRDIEAVEQGIADLPGVLECHHITGVHTLLIKARARNTAGLEKLISRVRSLEGVERTETMVVLSTQKERVALPLDPSLATRQGRRRK